MLKPLEHVARSIYRHIVPLAIRRNISRKRRRDSGNPFAMVEFFSKSKKTYYTFGKVTRSGSRQFRYLVKEDSEFCLPVTASDGQESFGVHLVSENDKKSIRLPPYKWNYLRIDPKIVKTIEIEAANPILGEPIPLAQSDTKKCVIFLVIDALGNELLSEFKYLESMPNTARFFNGCREFTNAWSQGEWTLPCSASIISGLFTPNHGVWRRDPAKEKHFPEIATIQELYKEAGYVTSSVSSTTRYSPLYGCGRGNDFFYTEDHPPHYKVTYQGLEQLRAFPDRSHFLYLHYIDVHHILGGVASCAAQLETSPHDLDYSQAINSQMLEAYSVGKKEKLRNRKPDKKLLKRKNPILRELDFHLMPLFDYLEIAYGKEDITAVLVADHGTVMINNKELLTKDRCNICLKVRSQDLEEGADDSIVNAVDILPSLTALNSIEDPCAAQRDGKRWAVLGGTERDVARIESISPLGTMYELVLRDDEFVFYYKTSINNGVLDIKSPKQNLYLARQFDLGEYEDVSEGYRRMFTKFRSRSQEIVNSVVI